MQQDNTGSEVNKPTTTNPNMATAMVMEMATFSGALPEAVATTEVMPPAVAEFANPLPVAVAVTSENVITTATAYACADGSSHTEVTNDVQQPRSVSCSDESFVTGGI